MHIHIADAIIHLHLHSEPGQVTHGFSIDVACDGAAPAPPRAASDATEPPAAGELWPGQGGRFICTLPALLGLPTRHLVFGEAEEESLKWGPTGEFPGAASHHDGAANTKALIAAGTGYKAAHWAASQRADGHDDFHLPSRLDLLMAYICAPKLFKTSGYYWSSTQLSRSSAFVQGFEYGYSGWSDKDDDCRVRACRVIPLTA